MKKNSRPWLRPLLLALCSALLAGRPAFAQAVTDEEKLQWFLSRLAWWPALGFGLGALASWLWLRRVKYVPEELTIDRKVRLAFWWSLLAGGLISTALLWADLAMTYEFETASLSPAEAFQELLRSWHVVPLLSAATLGFYLASLLFTRRPFSGRYALRPRARR